VELLWRQNGAKLVFYGIFERFYGILLVCGSLEELGGEHRRSEKEIARRTSSHNIYDMMRVFAAFLSDSRHF
jgi:hypothetical protein